MDEEATQPATQQTTDPRREGHQNSGLNDEDLTDIFCILHPASISACHAIAQIAAASPEHTIRTTGVELKVRGNDESPKFASANDFAAQGVASRDIALRLSADLKEPLAGYCFGRNPQRCDFIFGNTEGAKRISGVHFRIYITEHGIIMLEDQSTNGTCVEKILLNAKNKENGEQYKHMLQQGSLITLLMIQPEENIEFVVRIPQREGEYEALYEENLQKYFDRLSRIERERYSARLKLAALKAASPGRDGKKGLTHDGPPDGIEVATQKVSSTSKLEFGRRIKEWRGGSKYNRVGTIGKGAFAAVHKIALKSDGTIYAAKELEKRRFMKNGILDQKVDMEMQIMRQISHPHIVQYVDHVDWEDYLYIIMEYVPCGDLGALMAEQGPLASDAVKPMASQLLSALKYLHKIGVTHRDVKPDNILIQSHNPFHVKLTDFGLSKMIEHDETFLRTFCGTLLYCAPEVHTEYHNYDDHGYRKPRGRDKKMLPKQRYTQAIDLWSLGAVLFFALSGSPPYPAQIGTGAPELLNSIMTLPLDVRPLQRAGVSEGGIRLICSMLQVNPGHRPTIDALERSPWFRNEIMAAPGYENDEIDMLSDANSTIIDEGASLLSIRAASELRDYDSQYHDAEFAQRLEGQIEEQVPTSFMTGDDESSSKSFAFLQTPVGNARLFGEVNASALGSSGVIPEENLNLPLSENRHPEKSSQFHLSSEAMDTQSEPSVSSVSREEHDMSHRDGAISSTRSDFNSMTPEPPPSSSAAPSLLGTESLVGQLQMNSPLERTGGPFISLSTPDHRALVTSVRRPRDEEPIVEDARPAAKRIRSSRELEAKVPIQTFWDDDDKSTWHIEYPDMTFSQYRKAEQLAEAQGEKFRHGGKLFDKCVASYRKASSVEPEVHARAKSEPTIEQGRRVMMMRDGRKLKDFAAESAQLSLGHRVSTTMAELGSTTAPNHVPNPVVAQTPNEIIFKSPRQILARFTSTPTSVISGINLTVTESFASWGREHSNTIIFPELDEIRIPKFAFKLLLWKKGILQNDHVAPAESMSFWISTKATMGIKVNGVLLQSHNRKQPAMASKRWGELRHGDEVQVWTNENSIDTFVKLRFSCFYGASKTTRPPGADPFTILPLGDVSRELDEYCLQVQPMTTSVASKSVSNGEAKKDLGTYKGGYNA